MELEKTQQRKSIYIKKNLFTNMYTANAVQNTPVIGKWAVWSSFKSNSLTIIIDEKC